MNKRSTFAKMFLVGAMLMGANCVALRAQINLEGMDAFLKIDDLPLLRTGVQTHQFCSYDRAGDNYDHEYFALYTEAEWRSGAV